MCIVYNVLFQFLVEFDGQCWEKREWVAVHKSFQLLLVENGLVWVAAPTADKTLDKSKTSPAAALVSPILKVHVVFFQLYIPVWITNILLTSNG